MKKTYVIDTNVLLDDPGCIKVLRNGVENKIVLPWTVITELDRLKRDPKKRELVSKAVECILEELPNISVTGKSPTSNDIAILKEVTDLVGDDPILVTNDPLFRLVATILGLKGEEYHSAKPIQSESEKYTGYIQQGEDSVRNCFEWIDGKPHYHSNDGIKIIDYEHMVWKVKPRTMYQNLAFELMLDPTIDLVTLQSQAGFGKTFIALATALYLVLEKKLYDKIYVVKSPIEIGPAMGFLPGDAMDKLDPYFRPIYDLVYKLHLMRPAKRIYESEQKRTFNPNEFEVLPLAYIRGMNIENAVVIIDETQNISRLDLRALLTRMGENVKCMCLGDTNQVDNPYLNQYNNGLNWIVTMCKNQKNYGHIVLRGVKSRGPITDLILKVGL